jgi:hypothetical protein
MPSNEVVSSCMYVKAFFCPALPPLEFYESFLSFPEILMKGRERRVSNQGRDK